MSVLWIWSWIYFKKITSDLPGKVDYYIYIKP